MDKKIFEKGEKFGVDGNCHSNYNKGCYSIESMSNDKWTLLKFVNKEVQPYEDDIPAEKEEPCESTRFPQKNAYGKRQKSIVCKKSERKT